MIIIGSLRKRLNLQGWVSLRLVQVQKSDLCQRPIKMSSELRSRQTPLHMWLQLLQMPKREAIALYEMFIALAKLIVVNAKLWNLLDEWYKAYFSKTTETEKRTFLFNQKVAMEQNVKAFFQSELHTSFNAICGLFNMLHQTMKAEEVVAATMVEFDCVSVEDWLKKLQPVLAESLELSQNLYRLAENFILLSI